MLICEPSYVAVRGVVMVVVKMVGRDSAVLLVHGGRNVHCYRCASIIDVACNMLAFRLECSEL